MQTDVYLPPALPSPRRQLRILKLFNALPHNFLEYSLISLSKFYIDMTCVTV
jgi:hypothetical protein